MLGELYSTSTLAGPGNEMVGVPNAVKADEQADAQASVSYKRISMHDSGRGLSNAPRSCARAPVFACARSCLSRFP